MRRASTIALFLVGLLPAAAGAAPLELSLTEMASGLDRPLFVTHAPGRDDILFFVEQRDNSTGRIQVYDRSAESVLATPFLEVSPVTTGGEQGLLGLAFDPAFQSNGEFYVNYTTSGGGAAGQTKVERYTIEGDPATSTVADPASATPVLSIDQPFGNHNAGWMTFGPEENLWIATGDGGSSNDPGDRAQDLSTLLGKMLRIDPSDDAFPGDPERNYQIPADNPFVDTDGRDEIWDYGLRNPWRNSFDAATNDLYIADVGQNEWEEINFEPAGSDGGRNYGWRPLEGTHENPAVSDPIPPDAVMPIHEYSHDLGCSVTGGYVYRGERYPHLEGLYFFGDYCSGRIWTLEAEDGEAVNVQEWTEINTGFGLTSFGTDSEGELYVTTRDGRVLRIDSPMPLPGDANLDNSVDVDDLFAWNGNKFTEGNWRDGDWNGDGFVDVRDLFVWNANKFTSRDAATAAGVPEPATLALLTVGGLAVLRRRRC